MDEADGGTAERVGDHHLCAGVPLDAVVEFAELLAPSVQPTGESGHMYSETFIALDDFESAGDKVNGVR